MAVMALEAWAFGVPCVVGPAGDVYSGVCSRLAELLVEPQVDNPTAICQRLDLVLQHKAEIQALLLQFRPVYNQRFEQARTQLVQKLFEFKHARRRSIRTKALSQHQVKTVGSEQSTGS